jgi:choline-sulfatase
MMCVSFTGPHYPFKAPKKYWDIYSDKDIKLPNLSKSFMDKESIDLQWARKMGKFETLVPDSIARKARHAIMARVTMIDDYVGQIVGLLKELGLYDNTIIIYTSDHGEMFGEHGLWFKNTALEPSARVPLIFSGKNIPKNERISESISLLDMGPTLCGLTGIKMIYPVTDGRDISDLVMGKRPSGEGLAIMENYGEGAQKGYRMVRQGNYKLIYVPDEDIVLYDLENDPGEWNNLATDLKYKEILTRLERIAMDGWEDYKRYDEMRYESEERRMAINKLPRPDWDYVSPPVPHPTRVPRLK